MTNNLNAIRERGFNALKNELGPSGMVIFIRQFENCNGDYTEERNMMHKDLSIDDIVADIKKRNK